MTNSMTISQFARAGGVGVETVRFYQRRGLLPLPKAVKTTYREYDETLLQQLRFIRRAQMGGFTLKEIKELITFDPIQDRHHIQNLARIRLSKLTAQITQLQEIHDALYQLVKNCEQEHTQALCPIIQTLAKDN